MVFRYKKCRKFATGSGGFGRNLNFEPSEKLPGVPPLLNFENFEAALLGSRSARDDETLHVNFRGQVCKSAIG